MSIVQLPAITSKRPPWNKGRLIGQKRPLLAKQVWAIRARLELSNNLRNLALFNLAIDSKLRGCDLVRLNVADLVAGDLPKPMPVLLTYWTAWVEDGEVHFREDPYERDEPILQALDRE